jgi:hypothetical protein
MGNYNGILLLIVWNFIIIFFGSTKKKRQDPIHEESVKSVDCYKYAYNILLVKFIT